MPGPSFSNPLDVSLGDPFVLRWAGKFYLYGTGESPSRDDVRQIPAFVSDDLVHWTALGGCLISPDPGAEARKPDLLVWDGRFFLVVSLRGHDRAGTSLWVAESDRPEGPFELSTEIGREDALSLEGFWMVGPDGSLGLVQRRSRVDGPPSGTEIFVQKMIDPRTPSPLEPILADSALWPRFQANRLSAPLQVAPPGPNDVPREGTFEDSFVGIPAGLVEGPGPVSGVLPDGLHPWVLFAGRRASDPGRRLWLCPVDWGDEGLRLHLGTDAELSAPPLSLEFEPDSHSFDGDSPWNGSPGTWVRTTGGFRQAEPGALSSIWTAGPSHPSDDWAFEATISLPGPRSVEAGLLVGTRSGGGLSAVFVLGPVPSIRIVDANGEAFSMPLRLGDRPMDLRRPHVLAIRVRNGRAEVRVDGRLIWSDGVLPNPPLRLGLHVLGIADFDAPGIGSAPRVRTSPEYRR